jgi:hypothetical protein
MQRARRSGGAAGRRLQGLLSRLVLGRLAAGWLALL